MTGDCVTHLCTQVGTDENHRMLRGCAPIFPQEERLFLVSSAHISEAALCTVHV